MDRKFKIVWGYFFKSGICSQNGADLETLVQNAKNVEEKTMLWFHVNIAITVNFFSFEKDAF